MLLFRLLLLLPTLAASVPLIIPRSDAPAVASFRTRQCVGYYGEESTGCAGDVVPPCDSSSPYWINASGPGAHSDLDGYCLYPEDAATRRDDAEGSGTPPSSTDEDPQECTPSSPYFVPIDYLVYDPDAPTGYCAFPSGDVYYYPLNSECGPGHGGDGSASRRCATVAADAAVARQKAAIEKRLAYCDGCGSPCSQDGGLDGKPICEPPYGGGSNCTTDDGADGLPVCPPVYLPK